MGAMARVFLLFVLMMMIFAFLGYLVGYFFLGNWMYGFVIFFAIAIIVNVVSYWKSDTIVLRMYNARIIGPSDNPRLYRTVEKVALKADLPMPRVAIVPIGTPNAFATGRNKDNAVVAATQGLLSMLNDDELEGVIAHEMAHVQNRDVLIMTVAATVVAAVAIFARIAFWQAVFNRNVNPVVLILLAITAPIIVILIKSAISRSREYQADATGAQMVDKPLALARALEKLERGVVKNPIKNGNPSTSHMFIVNPFRGGFAGLFSSHPPTEERVARLRSML